MNQSVRFLPEALADLLETQGWYDSREPAAFPCVHGAVRPLVMRRFPYAVYFREVGDEIVVLAIHGRHDAKRWHERN